MKADGPAPRTRISRGLLVATLVLAPLAVGAVHPLVVGAFAAVLCLAACLAVATGAGTASLPRGRIGLLFAGSVAWTALQLVPLPAGLLRLLSPRAHAIWIDGPLAPARGWAPLTLDRSATIGALAFGLAMSAVYVCVRHAWRPGDLRAPRGPLRWVAASCLGVAVAAIAHRVVGAETVFGLYHPLAQHAALVSLPIVNPNHLAALTNLGVFACLGQGIDEQRREVRLAWIAGAGLCAVTTLLTLSRGGVGALVVAAGFFAIRLRLGKSPVLRTALGLGAVVVGLAAYVGQGALRAELGALLDLGPTTEAGRLGLFRDAARMAFAYPVTGAGRGAFALGFPAFDRGGPWTFSHPENLVLQLATEWGIPFAALFLVVCGAAWLRAARRPAGGAIRSAALAGVLVVVLQNAVDFSLEIAGVALPVAVCFAMVVTPRSERQVVRAPVESKGVSVGWIAAAAVALFCGWFAARRGYEAAGQGLAREASGRTAAATIERHGRAAMRAHPADAYLPIQVARGIFRTHPRRALRYLNRALWLDPRAARAHLLTGRSLLRLGLAGQAVLHYRAAVRWDAAESRVVAREVVHFVRDPHRALGLVPSGEGAIPVLRALGEAYLEAGDADAAVVVARALARRRDAGSNEVAFLARVLVGAGHHEEAIARARATHGQAGHCEAALWESVALEALGRRPEATRILRVAARLCPDSGPLRERLVQVAIEARDFRTAEQALAMFRGAVGASDEALAQGHYLEGRLEEARHLEARAAAAYGRAAELAPGNAVYLEAARAAWERIGRPDRAEPLRRALSGLDR